MVVMSLKTNGNKLEIFSVTHRQGDPKTHSLGNIIECTYKRKKIILHHGDGI